MPGFHYGLPAQYLSDVIERIQKRVLRVIYPQLPYQDALDMLELKTLSMQETF
jgi:hypothetical protein